MTGIEWLNRNSLRSFPIREDANTVSLNTLWTLPTGVLADIFITGPGLEKGVYLSSVCITQQIISVSFANSNGTTIATASAVSGVDNSYSRFPLQSIQVGVSGSVSFGDILEPVNFATLPLGIHLFSSNCQLETRTLMDTGIPPVYALSTISPGLFQGTVSINTNTGFIVMESQGTDNNDPISIFTFSLNSPAVFLSPCENPSTPCECPSTPIYFLNNVPPDANGLITIELILLSGEIIPLLINPSTLAFSILATGDSLCQKPQMPDQWGRLPGPAGNYITDKNPIIPYPGGPGPTI